jgi:hypothetical protein
LFTWNSFRIVVNREFEREGERERVQRKDLESLKLKDRERKVQERVLYSAVREQEAMFHLMFEPLDPSWRRIK